MLCECYNASGIAFSFYFSRLTISRDHLIGRAILTVPAITQKGGPDARVRRLGTNQLHSQVGKVSKTVNFWLALRSIR
jgi:hypothetical protein